MMVSRAAQMLGGPTDVTMAGGDTDGDRRSPSTTHTHTHTHTNVTVQSAAAALNTSSCHMTYAKGQVM